MKRCGEGRRLKSVPGIIGTGMASNIQAVKTKMVSVFATKFDPSLDPSLDKP